MKIKLEPYDRLHYRDDSYKLQERAWYNPLRLPQFWRIMFFALIPITGPLYVAGFIIFLIGMVLFGIIIGIPVLLAWAFWTVCGPDSEPHK